ncbi:MAG: peptidoglycan DD-metalloendopeptidase family protein [Candidatus Yanofskybacteria bacterium]|nr:peptidoglycan DD-metalloendopeptidase family protein [Candidatus Yanofskybacteria bacterium]
MKSYSFKIFLLSFFLLFVFSFVSAAEDINQKILDLRKQVEELEKKSEEYRSVVNSKQKEAQSLKREIDILNNQIYKLETQIKITDSKINVARFTITDLRDKIFDRQETINNKKEVIASLINLFYKKDQEDIVDIVVKNKRLSDFIDQIKQADNLNKSLLATVTVLKNEKEALEGEKNELEAQKQELESLNDTQKNKQNSLDLTKDGKDSLLVRTKGQEAAYRELLEETERKQAEFFAELKNLETQAVQSGAFIVHVTADSVPPRGTKFLKWPYDDHVLTQSYGYTTFARSRRKPYGGDIHNGIDLASGCGTAIKAAAAGAVLASGFNDGFGNWVAVRHENNIVTVYAHMRDPSGLANGTAVTVSSILGYEGNTGSVFSVRTGPCAGSHLHLSVYKDFFTYINDKNGQLYFNYSKGALNPLDYL